MKTLNIETAYALIRHVKFGRDGYLNLGQNWIMKGTDAQKFFSTLRSTKIRTLKRTDTEKAVTLTYNNRSFFTFYKNITTGRNSITRPVAQVPEWNSVKYKWENRKTRDIEFKAQFVSGDGFDYFENGEEGFAE